MTTIHNFIYLDNNATTPVDPLVLESMLPYFTELYGNASSTSHLQGRIAANAVEQARESVAELIGAIGQEISFCSGATEAINIALKGIFWRYGSKGKHFVTAATEHKAVLDTLAWLEKKGAEVSILGVDKEGNINLSELENSIRPDTIAVAIMLANNETGVIHPIEKVATIVHRKESILVCDATQAVGKIKVNVDELGIDVLCLSAHKIYGPKGIGALYLRRKNPRVSIEPLLHGGGHEKGIRSGTLNVPGIVGLGKAAQLSHHWAEQYHYKVKPLRDHLEFMICEEKNGIVNGDSVNRLPNTLNIRIPGLKAENIIQSLRNQVALSTGSACSSAQATPSHVLSAMGLNKMGTAQSMRFSLGIPTTAAQIDRVIHLLREL